MQRYTSLLWNSDKKTVLGKNGVSWMSILLGTLVIVLIVGVFINSILEVKYARQEKEAKMRKMILEKKRLFFQYGIFDMKNKSINTTDIVRVKLAPKTKPQKFSVSGSNKTEVFLEKKILAEKTEEFEEFRDSIFLLRNKRNTSGSENKPEQATLFTESISSNDQDTSLDEEDCVNPEEEQISVNQKVEKNNGIGWPSFLVSRRNVRDMSESENTMAEETIPVESANNNMSLDEETCSCPEEEEVSEISAKENEKHNGIKGPALFVRRKRDMLVSKNTTVQDTLSIESTNDQIPSGSLNREHYSDPTEKENSRKPVSFIMADEPYLPIKKRNDIKSRSKRQYYQDYTDRTPLQGYENQIKKLTKRENAEESRETSDSQHSFVVSHEIKTSEATRQRTKKYISGGMSNFFRKFITALKPKSTKDVYGKGVKAAESEDTDKQFSNKMHGKYNTLIPKNETAKRIPIFKLLNKFANTKLERLQKRNTNISTVAKLIEQQRAEGNDLNTTVEVKNTNKLKITIFFDNIADTNLEQFKRNDDVTEVFDKNIGDINKDQSTSFMEKLARAKIERLRRNVPIYTTLTDVFDKSASEKNDTTQDGYVVNLSLGAGPLIRNRRV